MKPWGSDKILLLDGGMGSMLQSRGLKPGMAPEWMILEQPRDVMDVHRQYIDAGSDLIETNTFGATRHKLAGFGLESQTEIINKRAVELGKKAALGSNAKVAGSVGPIGELLAPLGIYSPEEAYQNFEEQCRFLVEGGADLINIETMSDPMELKLAVMAAVNQGVPVMAEASFMANGRMLSGTQPEVVAAILDGFDLAALGINCSLGPNEILPLLEAMAKVTSRPLIVQPNAGIPFLEKEKTVFPLGPDEFGVRVEELIRRIGPAVVGGCCGTTPDHIHVLREIVDRYQPRTLTPAEAWVTGRATGFAWTGVLPESSVTLRPLGKERILCSDTPTDLFGAITYCKQSKAVLVCLEMDAWEEPIESITQWLREFQSYYSGGLGVVTNDGFILQKILYAVVGRPLIQSCVALDHLPEILRRVPGIYLSS